MPRILLAPVLAAVALSFSSPFSLATGATATFGDKQFAFPAEYTLQLAAGQPLVERPIEACFDDQGRLYVTESSGSNDPVQEQLVKKPHRVLRLVDSDGDGVFDQRSVFADGLMLPQGCLWHQGALYVAAPPQIWKFTDADDDGVAEKREVWFDGKTLTGCANDLHGPYAGPDGWIYWCKGAFAEQVYDLPGQPGWKTSAAHVFRARPDGSGLEPVFTAGMDNPVGIEWTPEGEMIVAGTFLQDPVQGRRDGLIHAVYGGVWGKMHGVLEGHARTGGGLMPVMTHLGPAAPCGIARYGRDLLVAQFNLHTVSRHTLIADGASYHTTDSTFLTCDHPDFHPTDVLQAPDGSVLVLDTGGWYKLCCPTSQLAKPNVLGGIYRLRKVGGEVPVASPPPQWTIGDLADAELQMQNLRDPDLHVRRRAAGALGRSKVREAVPTLLESLSAPDVDRFLFHSVTYALLQIQDAAGARAGLLSAHPTQQAAGLYALEQMPEGGLIASEVIERLTASDARVREAAAFVAGRHREWSAELTPWFQDRLRALPQDESMLRNVLRSFLNAEATRRWLGEVIASAAPLQRDFLLSAMAEARAKQLPADWIAPLTQLLTRGEAVLPVLRVLSAAPPPDGASFDSILRRLSGDETQSPAVRLAALAHRSAPALDAAEFRFVLTQLQAGAPAAAQFLNKAHLTSAQLLQLVPQLASAGIAERAALLKAFAGSKDPEVGAALLHAITTGEMLGSLPRESVAEAFTRFPPSVRQELAAAQFAATPTDQRTRLDELEKSLGAGDAQRGSVLFQSAKASCTTCHPVGYVGSHFGPDLSKIGAVRTRRDLIEAIVFPSASFVRSYETVNIVRHDGIGVFGIVTDQTADALMLTSVPNTPALAIPRSEIKATSSAAFSLMPQGFDHILTPGELADIVAYLQSMR